MYHKVSKAKSPQPKQTVAEDSGENNSKQKTKASHSIGVLPKSGYVRLAQLIPCSLEPEKAAVLPVGAATVWRWVKAGTFPKPLKLSKRITVWPVGDIKKWLSDHGT